LPQAGVQLVRQFVRNSIFGSRPSLTDTPACGKLPPRCLQADSVAKRKLTRWAQADDSTVDDEVEK